MVEVESIINKPVYAAGNSTVNIRENVTTDSKVIGNIAAGQKMGTATGKKFPDLENKNYYWYEINTNSGLKGYVREDVATFTAPSKTSSATKSGSTTEYLKTAFDTESGGFPVWAIVAIVVCFVLMGVATYFLIKKRKGKK